MNLLDAVLWLPLVGFVALLMVPREKVETIRRLALGVTLAGFVLSLGLAIGMARRRRIGVRSPIAPGSRRRPYGITPA